MKSELRQPDGGNGRWSRVNNCVWGSVIRILMSGLLIVSATACKHEIQPSESEITEEEDVAPVETTAPTPVKTDDNDDNMKYRGVLITEHDNIKVYANYGLPAELVKYGDGMVAEDETYLIRCVDDVPTDTMVLVGPYMRLIGKDKLCKITVGVDTVNVNIRQKFNRRLDLRYRDVIPGCRYYRFAQNYRINDHSMPTDFQINLALPDSTPAYILNFINRDIRDDVADYFENNGVYPHISLYDIENGTVPEMMRHYFLKFRRLYREEEGCYDYPDSMVSGGCISYQTYAYPVWQSPDTTLVTWKFYDFSYCGGAHGGYSEIFLTFDNTTGEVLGKNDFYTNQEFRKAIKILTRKLNEYYNIMSPDEYRHTADLDLTLEDLNKNEYYKLTTVVADGKIYPRPALTRHGIVFSYQTYQKGCNADGVMHFTVPYNYSTDYKGKSAAD